MKIAPSVFHTRAALLESVRATNHGLVSVRQAQVESPARSVLIGVRKMPIHARMVAAVPVLSWPMVSTCANVHWAILVNIVNESPIDPFSPFLVMVLYSEIKRKQQTLQPFRLLAIMYRFVSQ